MEEIATQERPQARLLEQLLEELPEELPGLKKWSQLQYNIDNDDLLHDREASSEALDSNPLV